MSGGRTDFPVSGELRSSKQLHVSITCPPGSSGFSKKTVGTRLGSESLLSRIKFFNRKLHLLSILQSGTRIKNSAVFCKLQLLVS